MQEKSDNLRRLNVSAMGNSKFKFSQNENKAAFKSSENRFEWQTKKMKNVNLEVKKINNNYNKNLYSDGKWENLINTNYEKKKKISKSDARQPRT